MAPLPDATAPPTPSSSNNAKPESALPGIKRGIAIGVAASVCILLIALLTYFVIKKRRKQRAQLKLPTPPAKEDQTWPQEKSHPRDLEYWAPQPPPKPPVEVDARPIFELDAGQVPELPEKPQVERAELEGRSGLTGRQELGSGKEAESDGLKDWERWNGALERKGSQSSAGAPRNRDVPTLCISPPDPSPLERGSFSMNVSPLLVSPLEEAYVRDGRRVSGEGSWI